MVYKKYNKRPYYKKKMGYGQRAYYGGKSIYGIYREVQNIKDLVNAETKHFDTSLAGTGISSTGRVDRISQVSRGDANNSRDGNSILCKGLQLRYTVSLHATNTHSQMRVMVIRDKSNKGVAPTVTDILETINVLSPWEHLNTPYRYRILYDKIHSVNNNGGSTLTRQVYLNLKRKHIKYLGAGATDADQGPGSLWLLLISSEALEVPLIDFNTRLSFHDN